MKTLRFLLVRFDRAGFRVVVPAMGAALPASVLRADACAVSDRIAVSKSLLCRIVSFRKPETTVRDDA